MPESTTAQGPAMDSEEGEDDRATQRLRRETPAEAQRREERELRAQTAEERYQAGYAHHIVFARSEWQLYLPEQGSNKFE
eukprot:913125-Rhodomonas_salina.1